MKVIVYTTSHTICPHCKAEKEYLASKNVTFEEKDVYTSADNLKEMLSVSENFSGVPFTILTTDDGVEHKLKGFTIEEFDKILSPVPGATQASSTSPITGGSTTTPPADTSTVLPTVAPAESDSAPVVTPSIAPSSMPGEVTETPSTPSPTQPATVDPVSPAAPTSTPGVAAPAAPIDTEAKNRIDSLLSDLQTKSASTTPFGQGVSSPSTIPTDAPIESPVPAVGGPTIATTTTTTPAPASPNADLPNIPNFPGK